MKTFKELTKRELAEVNGGYFPNYEAYKAFIDTFVIYPTIVITDYIMNRLPK